MQYPRIFGPARLGKALLVGMALCLATVSTADAGKRKHRRAHQASAVSRTNDDGGIASSSRYAAFVVDDKTGRVLYAKNEDALRHPASLTKMMTLYLLFEDLKKRRVTMTTRLTVSAKASSQSPSKLGLRPGQTIAVEDAIRALVTKSANDVAVVIAENLGGSEEAFARRMTSTARRLGMSRTTFYNASGLPNAAQYTSARDMVTLGRVLQERFPAYYRYFSTRSFAWGSQVIGNHNNLLRRLEGIDGIKTGYTEASGFNLVSSIWRDDRHLVAAVMGGSSARQRDDHMAALLTRHIGAASSGAKVSSVLHGNGRSADAGDDDEETSTEVAAAPLPPPSPVAAPLMLVPPDREASAAPTAPIGGRPSMQPRIARSDVVPLDRSQEQDRASADHGAAVAMARAILLPQTTPVAAVPAPATRAAAPTRVAEAARAVARHRHAHPGRGRLADHRLDPEARRRRGAGRAGPGRRSDAGDRDAHRLAHPDRRLRRRTRRPRRARQGARQDRDVALGHGGLHRNRRRRIEPPVARPFRRIQGPVRRRRRLQGVEAEEGRLSRHASVIGGAAMFVDQPILGLVDLGGEKRRAPHVGMHGLHEPAMGFANLGLRGAWAKAENLMGLLVGHRARSRRAALPRCRVVLRVLTPEGHPAVQIRFEK